MPVDVIFDGRILNLNNSRSDERLLVDSGLSLRLYNI